MEGTERARGGRESRVEIDEEKEEGGKGEREKVEID
jgi:hypothetical protein